MRTNDLVALASCTSHLETLHLLSLLPPTLRHSLQSHPDFVFSELEELFLHVGQCIEARGGEWTVILAPPTPEELLHLLKKLGKFGEDGRSAVPGTSHRASVWRGKSGESLGVTIRVGRYIPNAAQALVPLAESGSVLIISKAGKGKTTLLRDLSSALAHQASLPRVTVVDTSNEIGGDAAPPLAFLGRCRRMQVPTRSEQGKKMIEVIQNHSPEFLVVDEIASEEEANAAWSITQRGVHLVASCHGENLTGLLQNKELNLLVGGAAQAFLSNEERRLRNKLKKSILERPHASPFDFVVELRAKNKGYLYHNVNKAVDLILDGQDASNDVSVGCALALHEPLPERLRRIVVKKKENPFLNTLNNTENGEKVVEQKDANGYTTFSYNSASQKGDQNNKKWNRKKDRKKTDAELYDEINSFL
ncbi:single-stranded nucleic acid binding protein R3H domain-containing protein [Angomonas deanei]|nr:single-stranded nucleic acid binding protein R3H domain-containing protein [Angomonas deanei]|eukprot:EPY33050.1 single-stranded nucleic acid binding protein R3H domain-containing protein [Angomonas deanei]